MMPQSKERQAGSLATHERYRLCPQCANFCALAEPQAYCMICGAMMIEECGGCKEPIIYPTARYCPACGDALVKGDGRASSGE
jgi:hypothetical protein